MLSGCICVSKRSMSTKHWCLDSHVGPRSTAPPLARCCTPTMFTSLSAALNCSSVGNKGSDSQFSRSSSNPSTRVPNAPFAARTYMRPSAQLLKTMAASGAEAKTDIPTEMLTLEGLLPSRFVMTNTTGVLAMPTASAFCAKGTGEPISPSVSRYHMSQLLSSDVVAAVLKITAGSVPHLLSCFVLMRDAMSGRIGDARSFPPKDLGHGGWCLDAASPHNDGVGIFIPFHHSQHEILLHVHDSARCRP
ncbi:unnamed protein product [Mycena citricolor]|uniref:Uncharacterized protein n=1 Tax=Mycena citricolor TaxID=2018698 RepID=A0AAD2GW43_9AGAR|nr:unnamed protein product [Mycena citricolor]